ncbi:MAG: DDE-type integrase/transposase/recombinase [Gammaproteobacteria bacterium]|nr:DDE-type integrase/transposase/recombinase [Gammaproteobacteria bacterium]
MLHAISLARYSIVYARAWAADSINARVRLAAENDRLHEECALLREELRIKDTRTAQLAPQRRPHYGPHERMAILELRAARGWSLKQTAHTFLLNSATIASWMKRIDEQGPRALLQLREPVNKFPDFVRYIVQRLKTLSPSMGKVKIAETLCRAGLHLGATTVGRILTEDPQPQPGDAPPPTRVVTAERPNHVWHVDLTAVPTSAGFWAPWLPFSLPQCWPFCWWIAVAIDHYSRRVMDFAIFKDCPTSVSVQSFIESAIDKARVTPKYLICDKGRQFWCDAFKRWCDRKGIKPRFGAVGQHGSIAIVERFILSLKSECTRVILVPLRSEALRLELTLFADWYNGDRSHSSLHGNTPHEIYREVSPARERPRYEPRARWPRSASCAFPQVPVAGQCGARVQLDVRYHCGRRHLPIVSLRHAA